jgi:Zn ribbon nucleic-acid-binding protein
MLLSCPNCSAIWGMEEIDEQSCGACGYPDPDEDDYDEYIDENEITDFDEF